jgi:transposase InsO family protein
VAAELGAGRLAGDLASALDFANKAKAHNTRRVHAELWLGRGIVVGHGAVELLMRRAGLAGAMGRPKWRHAKPDQIAVDLVDRNFARTGPNQLWVTDITEHPTREGKVYCAVVLDAFSRRVVGWSIDATPTAALVTNALGMAIQTRTPPAGAIIHSDQGAQYTSLRYTTRLAEIGAAPSIGTVGDSYDNSLAESTIGLFKTELIRRHGPWRTLEEVELATLGYIDWFNHHRLHGEIGNLPPAELEATYYRQPEATTAA